MEKPSALFPLLSNSFTDSDGEPALNEDHQYAVAHDISKITINPQNIKYSKMKNPLTKLSQICDRYGVSYRAAAAIASAVLQDVNEVGPSSVIDHSRLRRARKKTRDMLLKSRKLTNIEGLFFDGRKDKTMFVIKKGSKFYRRIKVEEHITLVQEPGSVYLGHATPSSGTAKDSENAICSLLEEENRQMENIVAVGCDGTNVNTGRKNGIISRMEQRLDRPLQWLICQLHANELPLRHLLSSLDGPTSGPVAFSGPIGRNLKNCENMKVIRFVPIQSSIPENFTGKLSQTNIICIKCVWLCQTV